MQIQQRGGEYRLLSGIQETPHDPSRPHDESEMMHEKNILMDAELGGDGLLKGGDSTNDSLNAYRHNFENAGFWKGYYLALFFEHFNYLWNQAFTPEPGELVRLVAQNEARRISQGKSIPWKTP